jgi:sulfofructose kinase
MIQTGVHMDVVGIGYPCIDFLINIDRMPESNGATLLREYSWQGGGKVPTALAALGRLGVHSGLIGAVGGDTFSRFCVEDLERHCVDTSRMKVDPEGTTSLSIPISETEKRTRSFIFNFGTCRKLAPADLDEAYIAQARLLHLADVDPVSLAGAAFARAHGAKVVIDADYHRGRYPAEAFRLLDVVVGSEDFYNAHFPEGSREENCKAMLAMGPEAVVFTFGERGCVGMDAEGYFELPAYKVEAADTTGAGDVFHGAYLYGMLQGWGAAETARFASAVAAIKCTRIGGRAAMPDLKTTMRFMRDGTIDYEEIDRRVAFYRNLPGTEGPAGGTLGG